MPFPAVTIVPQYYIIYELTRSLVDRYTDFQMLFRHILYNICCLGDFITQKYELRLITIRDLNCPFILNLTELYNYIV